MLLCVLLSALNIARIVPSDAGASETAPGMCQPYSFRGEQPAFPWSVRLRGRVALREALAPQQPPQQPAAAPTETSPWVRPGFGGQADAASLVSRYGPTFTFTCAGDSQLSICSRSISRLAPELVRVPAEQRHEPHQRLQPARAETRDDKFARPGGVGRPQDSGPDPRLRRTQPSSSGAV